MKVLGSITRIIWPFKHEQKVQNLVAYLYDAPFALMNVDFSINLNPYLKKVKSSLMSAGINSLCTLEDLFDTLGKKYPQMQKLFHVQLKTIIFQSNNVFQTNLESAVTLDTSNKLTHIEIDIFYRKLELLIYAKQPNSHIQII